MKLGLSGHLTRAFIRSPLTPLFLLAALAVGLMALFQLPREEEPQISVPMVDIVVQANGLDARDAVELVTKPLEDIITAIDAVDHVYSRTQDDRVAVTARFDVGTDEDTAIVRVHEELRAHMDDIPLGIPEPMVVGRGINDVAIVTLTLSPAPDSHDRWTPNALAAIAEELNHELIKVANVGLTYRVGGAPDQIRVEPDPERLALYGVSLNRLVEKIENANRAFTVGQVRDQGQNRALMAGQTLQNAADIGLLLLTTQNGAPVYVKDVATVVMGARPVENRVWNITVGGGKAHGADGPTGETVTLKRVPAVTLALAKRPGANAVVVAEQILERLDKVRGDLIPDSLEVTVTRNYGETASEKANELLFHLGIATVSIVILITLTLGWREGLVTLIVIPTTILLTLFASWLLGFTLNRVSLFALIFSIGILVDDAIVVVENIVRHWQMDDGRTVLQKAIEGVAEVGNPTIIATLTIIVALMPMMFVSGLMGPYMSPIPANASSAMAFSFFVAVIITPWLLYRLGARHYTRRTEQGKAHDPHTIGGMGRFYLWMARPVLTGRWRARVFLLLVLAATVAVLVLFYTRDVTVKLLPFDNKSEVKVVADLTEGSPLEETDRVLLRVAQAIADVPEVQSMQAYVGTAAPFNFNGLVRHSFMRQSQEQGDLQINLTPKHHRSRNSHAIALELRDRLRTVTAPPGTVLRVVEVPPGPPVLATLLAEIYGPTAEMRRAVATRVREIFADVPYIVDVDDSFGQPAERLRLAIDQDNLEFHGVEEEAVYDTIAALYGGVKVGYSHRGHGINPVEVAVSLPKQDRVVTERLLTTPVPGRQGLVELGDVVTVSRERASYPLFRRDGRFAEMVQADLAGAYEAPIYGMSDVGARIENADWGALPKPEIRLHGQPPEEDRPVLLWHGEWDITYVTFRDMGIAFAVALLGIYLLVVGQFGSFLLPLVILTPVPLTLIGIVLGHWAFGAPFTATSMIGFIALAGIIVRNSILLVDFIRQAQAQGAPLRQCLLEAGAIRFKPIFLTAAAAMIGAAFILADPIFQGLAISLVFGLASSTALTLLVIPAIYVWLRDDGQGFGRFDGPGA